jgi:hypothetical protein
METVAIGNSKPLSTATSPTTCPRRSQRPIRRGVGRFMSRSPAAARSWSRAPIQRRRKSATRLKTIRSSEDELATVRGPCGASLCGSCPLVYRPDWRCDRELPDCVDDAQPNRHAAKIAIVRQFLGSFGAFRRSLIAVAVEHQVAYPPDVDFRYHPERVPAERLFTVNPLCAASSEPPEALAGLPPATRGPGRNSAEPYHSVEPFCGQKRGVTTRSFRKHGKDHQNSVVSVRL